MQGIYWGRLSRTTPLRDESGRLKQRERVNCNRGTAEAVRSGSGDGALELAQFEESGSGFYAPASPPEKV